jgi:cation transport ATPase
MHVAVLIVACPCALILATPTAMVAAIGGLARRGISSAVAPCCSRPPKSTPSSRHRYRHRGPLRDRRHPSAAGAAESDILRAAAAESGSITSARVIVDEACRRNFRPLPETARILPGRGAECMLGDRAICAGNPAFLAEHGILGAEPLLEQADGSALPASSSPMTCPARRRSPRPHPPRHPRSRPSAAFGIAHQAMLTGDRRRAAEAIAREVGIPNVEAGPP